MQRKETGRSWATNQKEDDDKEGEGSRTGHTDDGLRLFDECGVSGVCGVEDGGGQHAHHDIMELRKPSEVNKKSSKQQARRREKRGQATKKE